MRSRALESFVLITFTIVLMASRQLVAQSKDFAIQAHHHYQLIDMGTLGGPNSWFNSLSVTDIQGFNTVFYNLAQVQNGNGTFVGFANTSTPDPYPSFCYVPDCFVTHAFQWNNRVTTDLGTLPGGGSSAAFGINAKGWIAGNSENGETDPLTFAPEVHAVLWKNGQIQDLGTLGGSSSFSQAINNRGQITGLALNDVPDPFAFSYYYEFLYCLPFQICPPNATETRGFIWDEKNGMQDVGTLGGGNAIPSVINQHGQVAGYSDISFEPDPKVGFPPFHPFLWEKGKGMKDLGSFGGVETGSVNGLNERGEVTGGLLMPGDQQVQPFLWDGKKLINLVTPPFGGPGDGEAMWINEAGEVVGQAQIPVCPNAQFIVGGHAFLWKNGVMADLGTLPGVDNYRADFINAKTQIVGGTFQCDFAGMTPAFLWENGSMVDLNTLVPPNSSLYLYWAPYISDQGEIGAFGVLPDGNTHAVLLIPCDQNHPNAEGCDYSLADASTATVRERPSWLRIPQQSRQRVMRGHFALAHRQRK